MYQVTMNIEDYMVLCPGQQYILIESFQFRGRYKDRSVTKQKKSVFKNRVFHGGDNNKDGTDDGTNTHGSFVLKYSRRNVHIKRPVWWFYISIITSI